MPHMGRANFIPVLASASCFLLSDLNAFICSFPAIADVDFGFVTDSKLADGCGSDCKSPFVSMHKKGETDKVGLNLRQNALRVRERPSHFIHFVGLQLEEREGRLTALCKAPPLAQLSICSLEHRLMTALLLLLLPTLPISPSLVLAMAPLQPKCEGEGVHPGAALYWTRHI